MTDLTEESFIEVLEEIKKFQEETGEKISISPTKLFIKPVDIYLQGRKDMQQEIIDRLGNYDANKCAKIAASIPVYAKVQDE